MLEKYSRSVHLIRVSVKEARKTSGRRTSGASGGNKLEIRPRDKRTMGVRKGTRTFLSIFKDSASGPTRGNVRNTRQMARQMPLARLEIYR